MWAGTPTLRTPQRNVRAAAAATSSRFPSARPARTALQTTSPDACTVLMLANTSPDEAEACFYPDSRKLLVELGDDRTIVRTEPQLDYFDGE